LYQAHTDPLSAWQRCPQDPVTDLAVERKALTGDPIEHDQVIAAAQ
jgi:hypothetical protein